MADTLDAQDIIRLHSVPVNELARQPDALCALAKGLGDPRPEVCEAAAAILEKMVRLHRLRPQHLLHGFPAEARQDLLDRLAHASSASVRKIAADALREAEQIEAVDGFLAGLADDDAAVREACARALERLRLGPQHASRLAGLLTCERAEIRRAVLDALPAHVDRELLAMLAPHLTALLADHDIDVRMRAARLLEPTADPPDALWPVLAETVRKGDVWQRAAALQRLATLGKRGVPYLPAIYAAATDDSPAIRSYALTAMAGIAPHDPEVQRVLLQALADRSSPPRRAAISALKAEISAGDAGQSAFAALVDMASDELAPGHVRASAIEALGCRNTAPAVPTLIMALSSTDASVVHAAVETLGNIGPAARPAAPALMELLCNDDLRMAAAAALVAMDEDGPALRKALHAELEHGDDWSQHVAQALLDELGGR